MDRRDLRELQYITAIGNLESIRNRGILSHNRAKRIRHESVADDEIQNRRARKVVPQGRPLHDYVNLYLNARNPMLYRLVQEGKDVCVLKVNPSIIDIPGAVLADQNAASDWVSFSPANTGLELINAELVYAKYWTNPNDIIDEWRRKSCTCAEVLILDRVSTQWIQGIYVSCENAAQRIREAWSSIDVIINRDLFFR